MSHALPFISYAFSAKAEAQVVAHCAGRLQASSPVKALPKRDPAYYQYSLKGVVVHSGTAFAGHYYSYIKVRVLALSLQAPTVP